MAEGQEQFVEYNGFKIRVLAVPEYSPHPPNIPFGYRESWLARAHVFSARIGASLKMSPGPTPRCGDGYVVADVDALLGHWPIAFSCLIQRGAFFFALMAS